VTDFNLLLYLSAFPSATPLQAGITPASVMPDLIRHPGFSGSSFDSAPFDSAQGKQDKPAGMTG
jgi:hypothetical protein